MFGRGGGAPGGGPPRSFSLPNLALHVYLACACMPVSEPRQSVITAGVDVATSTAQWL